MQHPGRWNGTFNTKWVPGKDRRVAWKRLFTINNEKEITRKIQRRNKFCFQKWKKWHYHNISSILTEAWYNERKVSKKDEAEGIIKTAAKLIKNAIKNQTHETDFYPTVYDIKNTENEFVPLALQTFIKELVKSPVKLNYLSFNIADSRPRTVMPLLFGPIVAADSRKSSKWLNNVLHKCGFAVSYDKVCKIWVSLRLGCD